MILALLALVAIGYFVMSGRGGSGGSETGGSAGEAGGSGADEVAGTPLFGGRVIIHQPSLPENMNYAIENSAYTRQKLRETHETLLQLDWHTQEWTPSVAEAWHIEDMVVLADGAAKVEGEVEVQVYRSAEDRELVPARAVYGDADVAADGSVTLSPVSPGTDLGGQITVPATSVRSVELQSVFTFALREGIRWQESKLYGGADADKIRGQVLDADDVYFSWSIYQNPDVKCDEKRFQFEAIPTCHVVDPQTIRFFGASQNAFTLESLGDNLTLHASHIYNLSDPDCPDYSEAATMADQAKHINDNEHNKLWVGVGPYQVTAYDQQYVDAERYVDSSGKPAYFDAATRPGYFDSIRWRIVPDDQAAMLALENGELDFFNRVKPEDFLGDRTNKDSFKESFNKGYYYLGTYGYTGWNLYSPRLKELVVRKAIAHSFDSDGYLADQYKGLARQITGPVPFESDGYPHELEPLEYNPTLAAEMLEDAGWYDRNGDGVADKDGVELKIEFLYPSGNDASKILGRKIQASVKPLGIQINLASLEWATFLQRMKQREFDAVNLAWAPALESDPEQLWHSKWGKEEVKNSSNNAGVADPKVDAMIAAIQREVDRPKRMELWKQFHSYIYTEIQPYLFGYNVPRKYAISNKIGGVKHTPMDPGFVVREWYFVDPGVTGTRAALMPQ